MAKEKGRVRVSQKRKGDSTSDGCQCVCKGREQETGLWQTQHPAADISSLTAMESHSAQRQPIMETLPSPWINKDEKNSIHPPWVPQDRWCQIVPNKTHYWQCKVFWVSREKPKAESLQSLSIKSLSKQQKTNRPDAVCARGKCGIRREIKIQEHKKERTQSEHKPHNGQRTGDKPTWSILNTLRKPVCGRRGPLQTTTLSPHLGHIKRTN